MPGELGGEDMKESDYGKWQIELSLAEHLFLAEEYEKALEPNLRIGERLHELFDFSSAIQFTDRALICSEKTQNKEKLIESLNQKGKILQSTFRYSDAIEVHNKSLEIAKEIGDRAGEAMALHQIGMVYEDTNRFQEALESNNRSLEIERETGNEAGAEISNKAIAALQKKMRRDSGSRLKDLFKTILNNLK